MILKTIGVTVRTLCGRAAGLDDAPEDSDLAGLGVVGAAEDAVRTEIERLYGVELPRGAFAGASSSTPRLLAARVFASWDPGAFPVAHVLHAAGQGPTLCCVHGMPGEGSYARTFAVAFGASRPMLAIRALGHREGEPCPSSIRRIAERYVADVVAARPAGPLALVGWCGGAWVALEMASRLRETGRTVVALALVDPETSPRHAPTVTSSGLRLLYHRGRAAYRARRARARFAALRAGDSEGRRYAVRAAFSAALGAHVPSPCAVEALLVHTPERRAPLLDPKRGIPRLLPRLETVEVAAEHAALFAPRRAEVAAAVSRFLDRVAPLPAPTPLERAPRP